MNSGNRGALKLQPQRLEKRILRTHDEAVLRGMIGYRP